MKRFNLSDYYAVVLNQDRHNKQKVIDLVDFQKLGFKKVARFFPEKGYGFDEDGVFFHQKQIHNAASVCLKGGAWIMKGRIQESPKGPRYADGTAVNIDAMRINDIQLLEGEYYETYKATEWKNDFGANPGEMWWQVSFFYTYGGAYFFLAVKLTEEEQGEWVVTLEAHRRKAHEAARASSTSSGSGSTSWTGVGLHGDCEEYYE